MESVAIYTNQIFTVTFNLSVWVFGVEKRAFVLVLIKCCWVAKCLEKLFYKIIKK